MSIRLPFDRNRRAHRIAGQHQRTARRLQNHRSQFQRASPHLKLVALHLVSRHADRQRVPCPARPSACTASSTPSSYSRPGSPLRLRDCWSPSRPAAPGCVPPWPANQWQACSDPQAWSPAPASFPPPVLPLRAAVPLGWAWHLPAVEWRPAASPRRLYRRCCFRLGVGGKAGRSRNIHFRRLHLFLARRLRPGLRSSLRPQSATRHQPGRGLPADQCQQARRHQNRQQKRRGIPSCAWPPVAVGR